MKNHYEEKEKIFGGNQKRIKGPAKRDAPCRNEKGRPKARVGLSMLSVLPLCADKTVGMLCDELYASSIAPTGH